MTPARTPDTNESLEDPRKARDFIAHFYPKANGKDAPSFNSSLQNDRMILEFLAAYYAINTRYARLRELRERRASAEPDPRERETLQTIETALRLRDGLEDRYAPYGLIAEPVMKDGFAIDVKFSFGNVDATGRPRSDLYTITTYLPIPLPAGTRFEELPIKIEGPGIIRQ